MRLGQPHLDYRLEVVAGADPEQSSIPAQPALRLDPRKKRFQISWIEAAHRELIRSGGVSAMGIKRQQGPDLEEPPAKRAAIDRTHGPEVCC